MALLVVVACAVMTWRESGYWKDGFSLYRRGIEVTSGNWLAHNNLGAMLNRRKMYPEAIKELEQAAALAPDMGYVHYNLAIAYDRTGNTASARRHYRETIRISPAADDDYYAALSRTMWSEPDLPEALDVLREGLRHFPSSSLLKGDEGYVLQKMGRLDDAIAAFRAALQLEPGYMELYPLLYETLIRIGKPEEARDLYRQLQYRYPREAQGLLLDADR